MEKKRIMSVIILLFIVVTGVVFCVQKYSSKDELLLQDVMEDSAIVVNEDTEISEESVVAKSYEDEDSKNTTKNIIYVHVCGAVKKPGVYKLYTGDRVVDAIKVAGGFNPKADVIAINQAKIVQDSEQIYIPKQGEISKELTSESLSDDINNGGSVKKININLASKEELMTLPGIGEAKADKIVNYRNQHGSFSKIEDIMNITGIKEGLFKKVSEYITV